MSTTWLLSVQTLDASNAPVTLYFSSGAYRDPSGLGFDPRIEQPADFVQTAYVGPLSITEGSGYGETVLLNLDGGLNRLADYAVDGRVATLQLDTDGVLATVLTATVESLTFDGTRVRLKLRDPQQRLAQPHLTAVYAGDNVLPAGVEGTSDDIKGQRKPRVYGTVSNISPVLVNTALYVYQASDRATSSITAVRDRGVPLTAGAAYTSLSELQTVAPAAGQFRAWQGYFRVGSVPVGEITCDATNTVTALGSVFAEVAAAAGATLFPADVAALDAVGNVGLFISDDSDTTPLLDELATAAGGYWAFDALGVLRAGPLLAPDVPVFDLFDHDIIAIERSAQGAGRNGLPVWRVAIGADRVHTVQSDLAAAAISTAARYGREYREEFAESASIKTRHPLSEPVQLNTALVSLSDAQTQASRLLSLLSTRRDTVRVTARLSSMTLGALAIGVTGRITTPRLGYGAGRAMRVLGARIDAKRRRAEITLWG